MKNIITLLIILLSISLQAQIRMNTKQSFVDSTRINATGDSLYHYQNGVLISTEAITIGLDSGVTGTLPIANGGTGSTTQNFVDLTTTQTISGAKSFSANTNFDSGTLYVDATNNRVGIGNNDPTQQLTISGPLSRMDFATRNIGGVSTQNIFVYDQNSYDNDLDTVNARFSFYLANPNASGYGGSNSDGPYFFMSGNGRSTQRGYLAFIAGNVSNPTGGDGAIDFTTGTATRMRITPSGNVGIGTTSPSAKLDVVGSSELNGALTQSGGDANFDSGTLFVDESENRVGIGTTSPSQTVNVYKDANATNFIQIENPNGGASARAGLFILNGATESHGVGFQLTGNNYTGLTADQFLISAGSEISNGMQFWTSQGGLRFNGSSLDSADLYIADVTGNVGIGTTSPSRELSVVGNLDIVSETGSFVNAITITKGQSGLTGVSGYAYKNAFTAKGYSSDPTSIDRNLTMGMWQLTNDNGNYANFNFFNQPGQNVGGFGMQYINHTGQVSDFYIATANGSAATTKMTIKGNGNVGIGTDIPNEKLHVSGNIIAEEGLTMYDGDGNSDNAGKFTNVAPSSYGGPQISFQPINNNKYTDFRISPNGSAITPNQASIGVGHGNEVGIERFTFGTELVDSVGISVGTNKVNSIYQWSASGGGQKPFRFGYRNSNTSFRELMRIDSSGNVGIGTTSPSATLDVISGSGKMAFNGTRLLLYDNASLVDGYNVFIGEQSGNANADDLNVTIGYQAGKNLSSTARANVYLGGYTAALNTLSGTFNTGIGYNTLYRLTSGDENLGIGSGALDFVSTGSNNIGIGFIAGRYLTTGSDNIYIGNSALPNSATVTNEIVIGSSVTGNGSNTVTLGNSSITKTILNGNVGIGTTDPKEKLHIEDGSGARIRLVAAATNGISTIQSLGYDIYNFPRFSSAIDFQSVIGTGTANGHIIFSTYPGNNKTERMRINSSGNVGIGTDIPSEKLDVNGRVRIRNLTGTTANDVFADANGVLATSSDERLKIYDSDISDAINIIKGLYPKYYYWKDNAVKRDLGFYAQEVNAVLPEAATPMNNDGFYGLNSRAIIAVSVKAIQEQQAIIETQEQKITDLETTIQSLITRIENLENK